jgi:hypothetical protein
VWPVLILGSALAPGQSAPPRVDPEPIVVAVPAPSPQPAPPPTPTPAAAERWPLMRALQGTWYGAQLDDNRLRASGWADASFTASTDRGEQLPMGFNYLANNFLLQQNWVRFERTVDQTATTPTWGFRSDTVLPGSDYRFTVARGLLSSQLTADGGRPNLYGIDPVQFYGELYLPQVGKGLDIKLGRFFCQYGVESIDATQNALGSRAYNFIYNPFTHTGLLTTLKLTDAWSVQNGIVTGSDVFIDPAANPTYCGSVKWAPLSGRDSVLFSVIVGKGRYDVARSFSNPEVFDLVYVHKFSDRLTYTLEGLYSFQTGFPGGAGADGFVNSWGVVQYLTYQFLPQWSGTARLEFFGDPQGFKTGFSGLYTAITTGVTYKPTPYLWLRPEVRFDNNAQSRPFEGKANLFTATMDVIIRW